MPITEMQLDELNSMRPINPRKPWKEGDDLSQRAEIGLHVGCNRNSGRILFSVNASSETPYVGLSCTNALCVFKMTIPICDGEGPITTYEGLDHICRRLIVKTRKRAEAIDFAIEAARYNAKKNQL